IRARDIRIRSGRGVRVRVRRRGRRPGARGSPRPPAARRPDPALDIMIRRPTRGHCARLYCSDPTIGLSGATLPPITFRRHGPITATKGPALMERAVGWRHPDAVRAWDLRPGPTVMSVATHRRCITRPHLRPSRRPVGGRARGLTKSEDELHAKVYS